MKNTPMRPSPRQLCTSALFLCCVLLFACREQPRTAYSGADRQQADSLVRANRRNLDTMAVWLERYSAQGNDLHAMLVCRELGKRYREKARFTEALTTHRQGLKLAAKLGDTLEIVTAYNNIGTDFRRMGMLSDAASAHYQALEVSERYSKLQSTEGLRNYVMTLNGIGNIHKMLDNRDGAENFFRRALKIETETGNELGQAINWANLGSISLSRGQYDSAYMFFARSLTHNEKAGSNLGIALCHNHFGNIHECRGEYREAFKEYKISYDLLKPTSDKWNWLKSCTALANIYLRQHDLTDARRVLDEGVATAREIRSFGHLETLHRYYSQYYEQSGQCSDALRETKLSMLYRDSLHMVQDESDVYETRTRYERDKKAHEIAELNKENELQVRSKHLIAATSGIILLLTLTALGFLLYALRMKSRTQQVMQNLERTRQNFFTNVTHEFRTPLTVILGLAENLRCKTLDTEIGTEMGVIMRQGNNLLELVNQLLDISKVRSEVGEPEWRTGDAVAYLRMIVENYRAYGRQRLIDLEFAPSEVAIPIDFVPAYLRKIIRNLLSNAIKFTPRGGRVFVTAARERQCLVITVADTGVGIAPQDLPHIFDAFYQGGNPTADMGTGIGLSLVWQMTEAMGGTVTVKSAPGKGTVFTVRLPRRHGEGTFEQWILGAENGDAATMPPISDECLPEEAAAEEEPSRPMLLVVEDNSDVAAYIAALLRNKYRLQFARNGAEGIEKAEEYMPDLILTDLMMPEMDGCQMCRRVRNSEILNHIPIIVVTAKSEESDRIELLKAGADAYLLKPFNADELNVRIEKLLEQRRLLREKYSQALRKGIEIGSVEILPADREFLCRLTDVIYARIADGALSSGLLADKLCMSQSQLNRKVKSITGFNTAEYILQMRMEQARRLLASTEIPVGEIAARCGFEDQSYFTRMFRSTFDMTPTQYRRQPK